MICWIFGGMKSSAECLKEIDAVILAGGLGTRLRSAVPNLPKCLAPISGIPFLKCYLTWLQKFGLRRVVLSLGYKSDIVEDYILSETWPGLEIVTSVESLPLGTAGALRYALSQIKSQTVLVANGDSFTGVNVCKFLWFHKNKNARVSMLLTKSTETKSSGLVATDETDAVTFFNEKPLDTPEVSNYVNVGMYLIEREAILEIPTGKPTSLEREIFPNLCGQLFFALKGNFPFIDIGTPETYAQATAFFKEQAV